MGIDDVDLMDILTMNNDDVVIMLYEDDIVKYETRLKTLVANNIDTVEITGLKVIISIMKNIVNVLKSDKDK